MPCRSDIAAQTREFNHWGTIAGAGLDVTYYRLAVTVTTSPEYLRGAVLLRATSTQNGLSSVTLDLMNSMTIDSVRSGGVIAAFTQGASTFDVTLDRPLKGTEEKTFASGEMMLESEKTPLLPVQRLDTGPCQLFLKLESQNPGGSIKDRIGLAMIETAEREGLLQPGGTVAEATAGNTGLGLALVASAKGYQVALVVPDKMSAEKVLQLKALGAQVHLTRSDVGKGHPAYYQDVAARLMALLRHPLPWAGLEADKALARLETGVVTGRAVQAFGHARHLVDARIAVGEAVGHHQVDGVLRSEALAVGRAGGAGAQGVAQRRASQVQHQFAGRGGGGDLEVDEQVVGAVGAVAALEPHAGVGLQLGRQLQGQAGEQARRWAARINDGQTRSA